MLERKIIPNVCYENVYDEFVQIFNKGGVIMAQDKVQLKREEVVGDDIVMQDINPKTATNSITDSVKGVPLDQTLAMVKNMINNKLSRVVNSVNGRTGVVILDAGDVGLENVDNVSFGDIKRWVMNYLGDAFNTKQIVLREYLSQIYTIIGTNDKAYANRPFYTQKGDPADNDYMAYIGFMYWDDVNDKLKEEHLQINVVGYTDNTLIYNRDVGDGRDFSNGGLGINIWKGEDALKIKNNVMNPSNDDTMDGGLYIDKTKFVTTALFFDGVYGVIAGTGNTKHSRDSLVYWTMDPNDSIIGDLPLIEIRVNDQAISMTPSRGTAPEVLHTEQDLKAGDLIITNFSWKDEYKDDDAEYSEMLYPGMLDSLTCRQFAIGKVTQAANMEATPPIPAVVNFYTCKSNVAHGLKLFRTNSGIIPRVGPTDTAIGIDQLENIPTTSDGTAIGMGYRNSGNISGINVLDTNELSYRVGWDKSITRNLRTIYPTGKSNNLLTRSDGIPESDSMFILPNFSLCVIPGTELTRDMDQPVRMLSNWNPSTPFKNDSDPKGVDDYRWDMIGINMEKTMFGIDSASNDLYYARNISGLRVNYDTDVLHESWFGFGEDTTETLYKKHSGGISVNVGDFLGIGSSSELSSHEHKTSDNFYDEGKVNVRIDRSCGLHNVGENRLGVHLGNYLSFEELVVPKDDFGKIDVNIDTAKGLSDTGDNKFGVHLGDYLSFTEDDGETPSEDIGKINVNIDKLAGLYHRQGLNKIAVNLGTGRETDNKSIMRGGLYFESYSNQYTPGYAPICINTADDSSGFAVKNHFHTGTKYENGEETPEYENNVFTLQTRGFYDSTDPEHTETNALEVSVDIIENDIIDQIPIPYMERLRLWKDRNSLKTDIYGDLFTYNQYGDRYPVTFDECRVYVAGGRYFIYVAPPMVNNKYVLSDENKAKLATPFFAFYSKESEYEYVKRVLDENLNPGETMPDVATLNVLRRQCHVLYSQGYPNYIYLRDKPDNFDPRLYFKLVGNQYVRGSDGETYASNTWYEYRQYDRTLYDVKAMIYEKYGTVDDLRIPDIDGDGNVDATDASMVLDNVARTVYWMYSMDNEWYVYDRTLPNPRTNDKLSPVINRLYWDVDSAITAPGIDGVTQYPYYNGYIGIPREGIISYLTAQQYMLADVDRDGDINIVDQNHISTFYARFSSGKYTGLTLREAWRRYLKTDIGIDIPESATGYEGHAVELVNRVFKKGVRVKYDKMKGLTTTPFYYNQQHIVKVNNEPEQFDPTKYLKPFKGTFVYGDYNENWGDHKWYSFETDESSETTTTDILRMNNFSNSLSIKIADPSSGVCISDPSIFGGLRFGSNGYLAIRINENSSFMGAFPNKNNMMNVDDLSMGSMGLQIDGNNVLGIQLLPRGGKDNGELKIDDYGCLHISDSYTPSLESLKFTNGESEIAEYDGSSAVTIDFEEIGLGVHTLTFDDGDGNTVSFNGREDVTITLGGGLKLTPVTEPGEGE